MSFERQVWVVGAHTALGAEVAAFLSSVGVRVLRTGPEFDNPDPSAMIAFGRRLKWLTHIVYCAAEFDPDRVAREPERGRALCTVLPAALAALAVELGARFYSIGTAYVFSGGLASRGYAENRACRPVNGLGRAQLEGENAVLAVNPDAVLFRTGWLYGDDEFGVFARLAASIVEASNADCLLFLPDDETGSPTWMRDLARVVFDCMIQDTGIRALFDPPHPAPKTLPGGIYHYADAGEATWPQFAAEVARLAHAYKYISRPVEVRAAPASEFPGRALRPAHWRLAVGKVNKYIVTPRNDWRDCLASCFSWGTCSHLFIRLHKNNKDDSI